MLQRIEIVAADVNILTVLVFRLFVVLSVRYKHRGGIHRTEKACIVLAQKIEAATLLYEVNLILQQLLQCGYIKLSLSIETLWELSVQHLHCAVVRLHVIVFF